MAKIEVGALFDVWARSTTRVPERPALSVADETYTYRQLDVLARQIGASIVAAEQDPATVVGVLAHRSLGAYAGVLGALASGRGYMPLHPNFPAPRTASMLCRSGARTVVVGNEALDVLNQVLPLVAHPLTWVFPDGEPPKTDTHATAHTFISRRELERALTTPLAPLDGAPAYLMFTSGSTGTPKGVPVQHRNVTSYLNHVVDLYAVTQEDRLSQAFDLTFDLSVHDMFVAWSAGAHLCVLPQSAAMAPARFIREHELSLWFSVPSVIMFLERLRLLRPGAFPSLRASLFCGEALPARSAEQWRLAAPNSVVDNLYGPTEATIAITGFRWNGSLSVDDCAGGVVPIGTPFTDQFVRVVDSQLRRLKPGRRGELCLGGSQVTSGYLDDRERTARQFVQLPDGGDAIWYRTGDLVVEDAQGSLTYHGRLDSQVQILGHRVELQEVDRVLREVAKTDLAASVAWPTDSPIAEAVFGFVAGSDREEPDILEACRQRLPNYMTPKRVYHVEEMPLNVNGKLDRTALAALLGAQSS